MDNLYRFCIGVLAVASIVYAVVFIVAGENQSAAIFILLGISMIHELEIKALRRKLNGFSNT